jgi:hypothetical protein
MTKDTINAGLDNYHNIFQRKNDINSGYRLVFFNITILNQFQVWLSYIVQRKLLRWAGLTMSLAIRASIQYKN